MTYDEISEILSEVNCSVGGVPWVAQQGFMGDHGFYVRVAYLERDIVSGSMAEQKGRKWYVSKHATRSEVVQTVLKAALTSAEHMVREHFLYRGERIFSPHWDVERLVALAKSEAASIRILHT